MCPVAVALLLLACSGSSSLAQLAGKGIACSEEGAPVDVAKLTRGMVTSPCYHCTCKGGEVQCAREKCESIGDCPVVETPTGDSCCPKCLTCLYLGVVRQNDEKWISSQDSCIQITCKGGVITSWRMQCVSECENGRRMTGFCCRLCATPVSTEDPCINCELVLGHWYHCYRVACPVLDCPLSEHRTLPNKCCAECKTYRTATAMVKVSKDMPRGYCSFRGGRFRVEEAFRTDPCTRCTCQQGGVFCRRFACPFTQCDASRSFYRENVCCSFCHIKARRCRLFSTNGTLTYVQHGHKWRTSECTECVCDNGQIACEKEKCRWKGKCPRGRRLKKIAGSCCHECELREATCTVFGDPHYITFDRLGYSFQGSCSYVLAQECALRGDVPEFVIIAHNGGRYLAAWTRRISVLVSLHNGSFFAIHLLPNKVVRERGRTISLPYIRIEDWPEYRVAEDPRKGHIVLSLNVIGVRVIWDGESFAEVVLSKKHQSKVCGLCGNFNGNPDDDLWPQYGSSVSTSIDEFAKSWRHGAKCIGGSIPHKSRNQK
ncbi:BMP-binding endothelial regulator protein [Toxocara canis]|uniref:BMP-binding endothelial regulator protein n=1 Tax=Toxocara canis TaxID=6265 RepID=A0A0B2VZL5_TOXCA|nr:BMP-binding endothelial regulator protein [Toxocara canis]